MKLLPEKLTDQLTYSFTRLLFRQLFTTIHTRLFKLKIVDIYQPFTCGKKLKYENDESHKPRQS